jgi:hypothetical protein
VLRQFSDQPEAVNEARSRLASADSAAHRSNDLAARLLFRLKDPSAIVQAENVATDGRTVYRFLTSPLSVAGPRRLVAIDIATGKQRLFEEVDYAWTADCAPVSVTAAPLLRMLPAHNHPISPLDVRAICALASLRR